MQNPQTNKTSSKGLLALKIVLIALNSQYVHTSLAIRTLQTALGKQKNLADIDVVIWEGTINEDWRENAAQLYSLKADIYAFSLYIWNIESALKIVNRLHILQPQALLIAGGPEVSFNALERLSSEPWHAILAGEAEITLPQLISELNSTSDFKERSERLASLNIAGLFTSFTKEQNPSFVAYPLVLDLDSIDFAYTSEELREKPQRIYYYESSRGCPFDCQYCLSANQKPVRFRSLDKVFTDLDVFIEAGVKQVKFVDRTFNCNTNHCLEIWRFLIRRAAEGATCTYHFELAAELINDEMFKVLRTAPKGLFQFEIGVQSTNPLTLGSVHRPNPLPQMQQNIRKLQTLRAQHIHLDLIAGLPFEDYTSFGQSIDWVAKLKPDMLQLGFLKMLHGSGLRESALQRMDIFSSEPPYEILSTNVLNHDQLIKLQRMADLIERYNNSSRFAYSLHYLEKHFDSHAHFYEQFDSFLQAKSYSFPCREAKMYQWLAEFSLDNGVCRKLILSNLCLDFCLWHSDDDLPYPLTEAVHEDKAEALKQLRYLIKTSSSAIAEIFEQWPHLRALAPRVFMRQIRGEIFRFDPQSIISGELKEAPPHALHLFLRYKTLFNQERVERLSLILPD